MVILRTVFHILKKAFLDTILYSLKVRYYLLVSWFHHPPSIFTGLYKVSLYSETAPKTRIVIQCKNKTFERIIADLASLQIQLLEEINKAPNPTTNARNYVQLLQKLSQVDLSILILNCIQCSACED